MLERFLIACTVTAAAGGLMLAGCGSAPGRESQPPTRVAVEVWSQGPGGPVKMSQIRCAADSARPVCRRLRATTGEDFAPVRPDAVCTAIYGGPAVASVQGRVAGRDVNARFDLRNGCSIARWEKFAWLLGDPPGVQRRNDGDTRRRGG